MAKRKLSEAKLRGLHAAAADRLGRFPSGTPVATTNSLRDAGLAVGRDACGHRVGEGHRHMPISDFITVAGRSEIGAPQPEPLTAAGTELERRCVRDLEELGYTKGFTVVEVEAGGVRIEMDEPEDGLPDTRVLWMQSELYANGWRGVKENDAAGMLPVPLVAAGDPGSSAGMCQQCHRGLVYDDSGRCVWDEYTEYLCPASSGGSVTHVPWEL